MRTPSILAFGGLLLAAAAMPADALNLSFTFRDFQSRQTGLGAPVGNEFPEFQGPMADLLPGLVSSTLVGGTPQYIGPGTAAGHALAGSINSNETFQGWWTDQPGVNQKVNKTLTLEETSPGIYTYDNSRFFPLDGLGFGSQGFPHNYHFTAQFSGAFTYQPGQTFYFRGDDDLWVYIDNRLAIDLGGLHGPEQASVDLDLLGLTAGGTYDFDLFFAERHTTESNFKMQTSIQLISNPVPEPASLVLFAAGLAALGGGWWRMRRRSR